jgi:hypothetical protein
VRDKGEFDLYSAEDPKGRQELQSSVKSIVEIADRWLRQIRTRQKRVRLVSSFLTGILVFFGILIVAAATIFIGSGAYLNQTTFATVFQQYQNEFFEFVGAAFLLAPISAIVTYVLLRRIHEIQLRELSSLTAQLKKIEVDHLQTTNGGGQGFTENALSLADKILNLLPGIVRKRNQDSLLYGVAAFVLSLVSGNLGAAILVGVIVWVYFRYETRKTYEREVSKFEEQKRAFEQRKKDFMDTL